MRAEEAAVSGLALGSVAGHGDALIQAKQAASNVYSSYLHRAFVLIDFWLLSKSAKEKRR
jgi:hypothetical protein